MSCLIRVRNRNRTGAISMQLVRSILTYSVQPFTYCPLAFTCSSFNAALPGTDHSIDVFTVSTCSPAPEDELKVYISRVLGLYRVCTVLSLSCGAN